MKHNIKFHNMGTSNQFQLKKLEKFKGINRFWSEKDGDNIDVYSGTKFIETFSKSNFRQFILVWISFGILKKIKNNYVFITKEISLDNITKSILSSSDDPRVQTYRDSRIICLLIHINYINNKNIYLFKIKRINTKKNQNKIFKKIDDFIREISWWEKETARDRKKLNKVIERIENEWK